MLRLKKRKAKMNKSIDTLEHAEDVDDELGYI